MSIPPSDASIPILTEVVSSQQTSDIAARQPPAAAVNYPARSSVGEQAVAPRAEQDWRMLERKITERVLHQIFQRVDFMIEHRVKESLAEILQAATDELVKDVRRGLKVTLEDVIKRAVAQEIAREQSIKD